MDREKSLEETVSDVASIKSFTYNFVLTFYFKMLKHSWLFLIKPVHAIIIDI